MTQDRPLALSFPLHGSQLIEASAGTGKTFTISALYLRLILGHGGEQGFERELLPPQILVVTFTDAATKELRERIRARLAEAARFFRGELEGPIRCCTNCVTITHKRTGRVAPAGWKSPCSGWTRLRYRPSMAGASACCASMPSTAAACSPRPWKPTTASCWARSCAITGGASAMGCKGTHWPGCAATGGAPTLCCHAFAHCSAVCAPSRMGQSPLH